MDASKHVIVYTAEWCGYCDRAKALLRQRNIAYEEINVDDQPNFRSRLLELTGRMTLPQVIIGGEPIGGYDELRALDRSGRLRELLAA